MEKLTEEIVTPAVFEMARCIAKAIWNTYDNQFGYVSEKVEAVDSVSYHPDNIRTFLGMFDHHNQRVFVDMVDAMKSLNNRTESVMKLQLALDIMGVKNVI